MPLNFTSTYMPALVELSPEKVQDARTRLEAFFKSGWPDLETSPNTVAGDLLLTPQAYMLAAMEEGMDRFMSDLDLGNVANNIIYNCDFVERYLKNFATDNSASMQASGVARLVFSKSKEYVLDRGTQFGFNDVVFSIYLPFMGDFTIYPVGITVPAGTNGTTLKDSGTGAYFADVPLVGHSFSGTGIPMGTAGLSNITHIPELGAITALIDFDPGTEEVTLAQLAERTRATAYSASLTSRNGAVRYVKTMCPFTESVYAICSGDMEMSREYSTYAMSYGYLDVLVRSKAYAFTETQTFKLVKSSTDPTWEGYLDMVGIPYYIESVTVPGYTASAVTYRLDDRGQGVPLLATSGAYSPLERLYIMLDDVRDATGIGSQFPTYKDDAGDTCINIQVRYKTDPMLKEIAQTVMNSDNTPVNTSVFARGFTPVIISSFQVDYVRKPGVVPLLDEARERIADYLGRVGAPDAYSNAAVSEIMREAGVKYTVSVTADAKVQWMLASRLQMNGWWETPPDGPVITGDASNLRVWYPAEESQVYMWACSPRTIRYYLLDGAIKFHEVREM